VTEQNVLSGLQGGTAGLLEQARPAIFFDVDGVLTTAPLHPGGYGKVGHVVWQFCERSGIGARLMRNAAPSIGIAVMNRFYKAGWEVVVLSGRSLRHSSLTTDWLWKYGAKYHDGYLKPDGISTARHKANVLERYNREWCSRRVLVDDQLPVIQSLSALPLLGLMVVPLTLIHMTDWCWVEPLLGRILCDSTM